MNSGMDEQVIFTTQNTGTVCNVHSLEQTSLRQLSVGSAHSAVQIGQRYLLVAQSQKALINVYDISGEHKKEAVEQRIPLPEIVRCLATVDNVHSCTAYLPWLLLASTSSGKLYVWEMNSGLLLGVKQMAHYQSITKIQSICNGKYIITSGEDSRVIIWQTTDLVCEENPKPVHILQDHVLAVTDFVVSSTFSDSTIRLFTASEDATIRSYLVNLSRSILSLPLATFTSPFPVHCLALDPADRACYIGTARGVFNLPLYYKINDDKISNLVQENSKNKLYSLVFESQESKDKLYHRGSLKVQKIVDYNVSRLEVSLDGSLLLIGDDDGRVSVTEIFSKQVLRTIRALTSTTSNGAVTNLLVTVTQYSSSHSGLGHRYNLPKIPPLQRNIYDKKGLHELWFQIREQSNFALPPSNLEEHLAQVHAEQTLWSQSTHTNSKSLPIPAVTTTITAGKDRDTNDQDTKDHDTKDQDSKDQEIAHLKDNIAMLKGAYTELRSMHETLLQERQ